MFARLDALRHTVTLALIAPARYHTRRARLRTAVSALAMMTSRWPLIRRQGREALPLCFPGVRYAFKRAAQLRFALRSRWHHGRVVVVASQFCCDTGRWYESRDYTNPFAAWWAVRETAVRDLNHLADGPAYLSLDAPHAWEDDDLDY